MAVIHFLNSEVSDNKQNIDIKKKHKNAIYISENKTAANF